MKPLLFILVWINWPSPGEETIIQNYPGPVPLHVCKQAADNLRAKVAYIDCLPVKIDHLKGS